MPFHVSHIRSALSSGRKYALKIGLGLSFLQSACAPVNLLNGLTPSHDFTRVKDISYGPLERHKLDIYHPVAPKADAPVIFYIYGGGWDSGSKDIYKFLGQAFTEAGYTFVIADYRIYPEAIFPSFIEDMALASKWVADNFEAPKVAIGHSAGAHITSLLALDPRYLAAHDLKACELFNGWIGLAGPYDFKIWEEPYLSVFTPDIRETISQPITFAGNSVLPSLILTGADDKTVSPSQSKDMALALSKAAPSSKLHIYEGVDHVGVITRLSKRLRRDGQLYKDVMSFIENLPRQAQCPK